jgi:hypothetical protein
MPQCAQLTLTIKEDFFQNADLDTPQSRINHLMTIANRSIKLLHAEERVSRISRRLVIFGFIANNIDFIRSISFYLVVVESSY